MGSSWELEKLVNEEGQGMNGDGGVLRRRRKFYWGNHPESEQEFYASNNVTSTASFFTSPSTGLPLFTRSWLPLSSSDRHRRRGTVFMVHGYGNDISWTFQSTPIFLAQHGFACYALDLPGHGRSYGLKAFVPHLDTVIHDCISYFNSIITTTTTTPLILNNDNNHHPNSKCFLYGESMGGAICLLIHLHLQQQHHRPFHLQFDGAVLAAPMCKISDSIRPPWPIPHILAFVAKLLPTLPIVPTADLIEKSVRVEEKRVIAASNPMRYTGKPRLGTVAELMRATDHLSMRLSEVTIPFLLLHGSADVVTDPEVSRELYDKAGSSDKTIHIYEGMMHSLLFGETDDNIGRVRMDILEWLNQRCTS